MSAGSHGAIGDGADTVIATTCGGAVESRTVLTTNHKTTAGVRSPGYQALLWLFVAGMIATHLFFFWSVRDRIARGDPDFTVFYTAGKMLREGRGAQLYDPRAQRAVQAEFARNADIRRGPLPFIHPPFEALVFLPLTFLAYRDAFILWNLANLGMLFAVMLLLKRSILSLGAVPVWQLVLACLAFFPVFANFHQGQDAILLLLIVVCAFGALDRDATLLAGCWLGLGIFKYHLILPLAVILAVWKGRKFVLGFAASISIAVLISFALVGWHGALAYPAYAWHVVSQPALGGIPPRQLPDMFGLLGGWNVLQEVVLLMTVAAAASSAALLMVVASLRKAVSDKKVFRLSFACAVITALLAGYSTNSYDLCLLILPLALSADYMLGERAANRHFKRGWLLPVIPLLISPVWFFLWMRWQRIHLMAVFLLWWLFVMLNEAWRARRQIEAGVSRSHLIANV